MAQKKMKAAEIFLLNFHFANNFFLFYDFHFHFFNLLLAEHTNCIKMGKERKINIIIIIEQSY